MIRVMVVEDHATMRRAIAEALDAAGDIHVVAECADGQEALEMIDEARPDVVVTDLAMPRLDGGELTRRVLRSHPDVRVLVLTATPHGALAGKAVEAGAHRILAKTGDVTPLIEAIRERAEG
jgi:DNA-binding NarL/FixJ family response regulator